MKILVCGGRKYADLLQVVRVLRRYAPDETIVIHGDATGADSLAERACNALGIATWRFPADWSRYGTMAGPIRNRDMLQISKPDLVIAFPGGSGTTDMIQRAIKAGVPVSFGEALKT